MNDHNHLLCAKLICPCCGWDPRTERYAPEKDLIRSYMFSCEMCPDCWMTYQADMAPEDRDPFVIDELVLPWP